MHSYDLYEIELEYNDNITIPFLPTRTKDGLIYLKNVSRSWRWGCEILFIYSRFMIKKIKIY